jgi:hypothetical protein
MLRTIGCLVIMVAIHFINFTRLKSGEIYK